MVMAGVTLCLLRIICCKPRLCPSLCPDHYWKSNKVEGPRNPAVFSVASSAMSTVTTIGVRYSRGSICDAFENHIRRGSSIPSIVIDEPKPCLDQVNSDPLANDHELKLPIVTSL